MINKINASIHFDDEIHNLLLTKVIQYASTILDLTEHETWNNNTDNITHIVAVDVYVNDSSTHTCNGAPTNMTISFIDDWVESLMGFKVLDIFKDRIDFCLEVNMKPLVSIDISDLTKDDIDEGFIFQQAVTAKNRPLTIEHYHAIMDMASKLEYED